MVSHMVEVVQLNVWQLNVVARVFAALVAFYLVMLVAIYLLLFYLCCQVTNLCDSCKITLICLQIGTSINGFSILINLLNPIQLP